MSTSHDASPSASQGYWRSLDDLEKSPEFVAMLQREFPEAASELPEGFDRRRWMQLMGASFGLAGLSGCRWPVEQFAPMNVRPQNRIPGETKQYASCMEVGGYGFGTVGTSYDGRPVKIDGNSQHPGMMGGSNAFVQASILGLYDPDRFRPTDPTDPSKNRPVLRRDDAGEELLTWADFDKWTTQNFGKSGGRGVTVLAAHSDSPTRARLRDEFKKRFPSSQWFEYSPLESGASLQGSKKAFGEVARPIYSLKNADCIACFDCDLFGSHPDAIRLAGEWGDRRAPEDGEMNRVYCFESQFSSTGAAADHRIPVPSAKMGEVLAHLEHYIQELVKNPGYFNDEKNHPAHDDAMSKTLVALAKELKAKSGRSLVVVGARQPAICHAIGYRINSLLNSLGSTLFMVEEPSPSRADGPNQLKTLVKTLGKTDTLVILGGNPAYDSPADVPFAKTVEDAKKKNLKTIIRVGMYDDETTALSTYWVPLSHPMESWLDTRTYGTYYTVGQPLISPIFDSRSEADILSYLIYRTKGGKSSEYLTGRDLIEKTFHSVVTGWEGKKAEPGKKRSQEQKKAEAAFVKALHDGYSKDAKAGMPIVDVKLKDFKHDLGQAEKVKDAKHDFDGKEKKKADGKKEAHGKEHDDFELEIVFTESGSTYDGSYANNGWLQEAPDLMTKVVWDNVAVMSPATAEHLGLAQGKMARFNITLDKDNTQTIEVPVYVLPGQAKGSIGLALGYGRTSAGHVGGNRDVLVNEVGIDFYPIRSTDQYDVRTEGVNIVPTFKKYPIVTTQDHHGIDPIGQLGIEQRIGGLVREGTVSEWEADKKFAKHLGPHHPPLKSLWKEQDYSSGYQWGMSIDLSKCLGCNACVVACQSENNVPIVGKDLVRRGRSMHWVRIDRYFKGDVENPQVVTQPVSCHHCENAPCEQVCPVNATVHDDEGLNTMVYNRCIGTRYCGNNCPYKVRRFNFFDYNRKYHDDPENLETLGFNPEVTVRSRGVMEKCTYCTQRIQAEKIKAKNKGERVKDGAIVTACQEACSTNAIEFGNLLDKESRVFQAQDNDRAYAMLAELNVKPRTTYMARIRNPNPDLVTEKPSTGHGHGGH